MGTINISVSNELIDKVNKIVEEKNYTSRSEVVRDALRGFFSEQELRLKLQGEFLGVVTLTYDPKYRNVSNHINKVQHKYENVILTTLHNHFHKKCLGFTAK